MADNRIDKRRLKNHLAYGWWKYALAAVICVMAVDMLFAVTAYRPPEERQVELYVLNDYIDTQPLHDALWPQIRQAYPEQELLTVMNINLAGGDMYAAMQFSTYAAAQQGDLCLLPRSEVTKLTAEGADSAFLELTPYIESGVIDVRGIDLTDGMLASESGQIGVYAIPADSLTGLLAYGCDPTQSYLCIMGYSGNADTAAGVMDMMIKTFGSVQN